MNNILIFIHYSPIVLTADIYKQPYSPTGSSHTNLSAPSVILVRRMYILRFIFYIIIGYLQTYYLTPYYRKKRIISLSEYTFLCCAVNIMTVICVRCCRYEQ